MEAHECVLAPDRHTTDTYYILVIHGTFNAPTEESNAPTEGSSAPTLGSPEWYQLNEKDPTNFCQRLSQYLVGTPLEGSVWRCCTKLPRYFYWSGKNDHAERLKAAEDLCNYIETIVTTDPTARIHLVTHSHGGQVILKAVEYYYLSQRRTALHILSQMARAYYRHPQAASPMTLVDSQHMKDRLTLVQNELLRRGAEELLIALTRPSAVSYKESRGMFRRRKPAPAEEPIQALEQECPWFMHEWAISAVTTRLGRVVFLGTPFYHKRWRRPTSLVGKVKRTLKDIVLLSLLALLLIYVLIFVFPIMFFFPLVQMLKGEWVSLNPLAWPLPLKFMASALFLFTVVYNLFVPAQRDTNVYFNELTYLRWSEAANKARSRIPGLSIDRTGQQSPAQRVSNASDLRQIEALVITSNRLDEALLALSSEPFVYAILTPRMGTIFRLHADWSPVNPGVGIDEETAKYAAQRLLILSFRFVRNLFCYVVGPLWNLLCRYFVEPWLTSLLLRLLTGAGYGLPDYEFKDSRIEVSTELGVSSLFKATHVDVTDVLLSGQDTTDRDKELADERRLPREAPWQRYKFLADAGQLQKKLETTKGGMWEQVAGALPMMMHRYGATDELTLRNELARIWFTLEERLKEASGAVDLNHSEYYARESIVRGIAHFLLDGSVRIQTSEIPAP